MQIPLYKSDNKTVTYAANELKKGIKRAERG